MNTRHITRFTYQFTNFQGWRVAICRQGVSLVRYFSDRQYGAPEISQAEAIQFRDRILNELSLQPDKTRDILMKYRVPVENPYPAGLKKPHSSPLREEKEQQASGCSLRSNKVMQGILKNVCNSLQLDTASVLKLSLYLFALQYGAASTPAATMQARQQEAHMRTAQTEEEENFDYHILQQMIAELETKARQAGLPSFEEFATGKSSTASTSEQKNEACSLNANMPIDEQTTNNVAALPEASSLAAHYMRAHTPTPPQQTIRPVLSDALAPAYTLSPLPSQREHILPQSHLSLATPRKKGRKLATFSTALSNLTPPGAI